MPPTGSSSAPNGDLTPRVRQFETFRREQAWWLREYALFRALHERFDARAWTEWPDGLRDREPAALQRARVELHERTLFFEYLQWIASEQWQEARRDLAGVGLFGDLPFMVSLDSADVWARQTQFDLGAQVGVPPDAFSATGQQWGLPVYRWDVHERDDYRWLRERARRSAELYDGCRIDHLVGFYRTYAIPRDGEPFFVPADPERQIAQGERLMKIFGSSGDRIIAEDLGTVPDYVRQSLARLGVPGFKVLRWERDWNAPGQPFRDPASYPAVSVAIDRHARHRTDARLVGARSSGGARGGAAGSWSRRFRRVPRVTVFGRAAGWIPARVVPRRIGPADASDPGRVRLVGLHQRARDRGRRQLDLPPALAGRSAQRDPRGCEAAARLRHWAEESGRTTGARPTRASCETAGD